MIDGESSKAERLQKVFIWRYDCSYSDLYLIKNSQDLAVKRHVKLEPKLDDCTITQKELLLDKKGSDHDDRKHGVSATGF